MTEQHITIDGIIYVIVRESHFSHNGKQRSELFIRRPNGRKVSVVTRYENGALSSIASAYIVFA